MSELITYIKCFANQQMNVFRDYNQVLYADTGQLL